MANFNTNELGIIVANAVSAYLSSLASSQAVAINMQSCNSSASVSSLSQNLSVTVNPSTSQASQNTTQMSGQTCYRSFKYSSSHYLSHSIKTIYRMNGRVKSNILLYVLH